MRLILQSGYPLPYPDPQTPDEQLELAEQALETSLDLIGVTHFEWKYTLTIAFESFKAFTKAQEATAWPMWSPLTLEAETSIEEGYSGHPAIICRQETAYCGFILMPDWV